MVTIRFFHDGIRSRAVDIAERVTVSRPWFRS
jgi:hypothetical protein